MGQVGTTVAARSDVGCECAIAVFGAVAGENMNQIMQYCGKTGAAQVTEYKAPQPKKRRVVTNKKPDCTTQLAGCKNEVAGLRAEVKEIKQAQMKQALPPASAPQMDTAPLGPRQ